MNLITPESLNLQVEKHLDNALTSILNYECWRLNRYLAIDDAKRGNILRFGGSTALGFKDVGYFNRVYDFGTENLEQLEDITDFYKSLWSTKNHFPIELIARTDFDFQASEDILERFDFLPGEKLVRLGLDLTSSLQQEQLLLSVNDRYALSRSESHPRIEYRHPSPTEFPAVLDLYLSGFGAPLANHPSAKRNMMQLFHRPEFITWCGFSDNSPIAIGMIYIDGPFALLAAGVTHPRFRNLGIHEDLIQLRIAHAKSIQCQAIYTWTQFGSQSHRNLLAEGFAELRVERVWRREALSAMQLNGNTTRRRNSNTAD
jgi:GNAT superfamily N-acetyltransferase